MTMLLLNNLLLSVMSALLLAFTVSARATGTPSVIAITEGVVGASKRPL